MPIEFLPILFLIGIAAQFASFIPKDFYRKINKFIILIPLPAITLAKIPHLEITKEVAFPIVSAWIVFFVSIVYVLIVSKIFKLERKTTGCLILCCGLGNTSFVGYPLIQYFYGSENLKYAIFVDQPGSFFILSTFGVLTAAFYSSSSFTLKSMAKRLFAFPPFIVFIIALFIRPDFVEGKTLSVLNFIGSFMVPLAMISLGMQFKWKLRSIEWNKFFAGIFYKLLLAPFIIFVLFFLMMKKHGDMYSISVMECAMPPMITSAVLATEYELDEQLAAYLPTIGLIISIPTLLIWKWVLLQHE